MVTVDRAGRKGRDIKALSGERQQHVLLLLLEDEEWSLPGSTVDAQTGSGAAPLLCFSLSMITIDEYLSLEKIFSYVPYLVFDRHLHLRMPDHGRVVNEAAVLRIIQECSCKYRLIAIGVDHGSFHVLC